MTVTRSSSTPAGTVATRKPGDSTSTAVAAVAAVAEAAAPVPVPKSTVLSGVKPLPVTSTRVTALVIVSCPLNPVTEGPAAASGDR